MIANHFESQTLLALVIAERSTPSRKSLLAGNALFTNLELKEEETGQAR